MERTLVGVTRIDEGIFLITGSHVNLKCVEVYLSSEADRTGSST